MAGIYIHVPFCSKACHYCDFHFSTDLRPTARMVNALIEEIALRSEYLKNERLETIYFGGGTPSVLGGDQLALILKSVRRQFEIAQNPEITVEANPDDLTPAKLDELRDIGINRLSIGIQTFDEPTLRYMNRSHSANQARTCIPLAHSFGFNNLSADLIFAVPPLETTIERFEHDLDELIAMQPAHISLYGLTIEAKTVFGNWKSKNKLKEVPEEINALQYELAIEKLSGAGYDQYEVSNFSKPGLQSRHNTAYWQGHLYLGIGPGAHSYNGTSRAFNISNNAIYMKEIEAGNLPLEEEQLSKLEQMNEYLLTNLRTNWGIDFTYVKNEFGADLAKKHGSIIKKLVEEKKALYENGVFRLNSKGLAVADEVALHFFSIE